MSEVGKNFRRFFLDRRHPVVFLRQNKIVLLCRLSQCWRQNQLPYQITSHISTLDYKGNNKGKVPHWGTSALQPKAYCALTPKEFLHSSLEALHSERNAAPQLAKKGTM
jgi:hypothetical protein